MKNWILVGIIAMNISSACVPLKQFDEVKLRSEALEEEARMLRNENEELKVKQTETSSKLKRLNQQVEELLKETEELNKQLQRQQHAYNDLNQNYTDALARLKSNSGNDSQNKELLAFLQKLQEDLQAREDALLKAEQALGARQKELRLAQNQLEESKDKMSLQSKRLLELEKALAQKDKALLALRKSISDALTGFSSDELKVHMKNGKVYVSLEEKLLFQSGSYQVNAQGRSALVKIAKVLEQNDNIEIIVEGHTDKIPFKSGVLQDNWDLSVKRATSVVRILLNDSQIDPARISAAGRSAYLPLSEGNAPADLQTNRRTEIILTPKMDDILNLIDAQ